MEISPKQKSYIERVAYQLAPQQARVDGLGRDRSDYRQLLFIRAWLAGKKIEHKNWSEADRSKWIYTAVRNNFVSFLRDFKKVPIFSVLDFEQVPSDKKHFSEKTHEIDLINKMRKVISSGEWDLLINYMKNDCNVLQTWQAAKSGLSSRGYSKRLQNLKKKLVKKCSRF